MATLPPRAAKLLIFLALPCLLAAEKDCIPGVTYLDPVTGRCDPCSDICERSDVQKTLARCEKLCQGYKTRDSIPKTCQPSFYYDKNVDRCEPCQSICLHPQRQDACSANCPGWVSHLDSASESGTNLNHNETSRISVTAALEMDRKETDTFRGLSTWVYGALIAVGALLVCGFVVMAVLWKPCSLKIKGLAHIRICRKRPHQEQGGRMPMLPNSSPIVRPGRGPFASPTEDGDVV